MSIHPPSFVHRVTLRHFRAVLMVSLASAGLAMSAPAAAPQNGNQPPVLPDTNPDQRIVEVYLEASVTQAEYTPGVFTEVWAYNGVVPGPTIEAEVGQTLIVHFTNNLPQDTSLHWHGMEVPANMDGSNIAQQAVPPGGQFLYEFQLIREGHYWYHPHFVTNQQIERGLHGNLLVRKRQADRRVNIPKEQEYVLTVDDVKLDASRQRTPFASDLTSNLSPVRRAEELLNGRQGNVFITNGAQVPTIDVVDNRPIRLRVLAPTNGRFMRLSLPEHDLLQIGSDGALLNDMQTRGPIGQVPDHHGTGLASDPDPSLGVLLTPSERADVVVVPRGDVGDEIFIEWHDFPTKRHLTFDNGSGGVGFGHDHNDGERPSVNLVKLRFVEGPGQGWAPFLPLTGSSPTVPIPTDETTGRLSVFFGHGDPAPDGSVMFFSAVKLSSELQAALDTKLAEAEDPANLGPIAGMVGPPPFMPQPFPVLTVADALHAKVGDVKIWEVTSFTGGAHTFHAHGFPFQALELIQVNLDGNTPAQRVKRTMLPLATKDNIMIPGRTGTLGRSWSILRAVTRFDDSGHPAHLRRAPLQLVARGKVPVTNNPLNPAEGTSGGWMVHCHILEHSARGMLTFLNLVLP